MTNLIGVCGNKFMGKDTIADYLTAEYGYTKLAFAQPVKEVSKILFGFTHEQLHGDQKEETDKNWGITPRTVFQFIGTDLIRKQMCKILPDIGEDFWVECLKQKCKKLLESGKSVVISDVRFENEANAIKDLGGIIIRVHRSSANNDDSHESENSLKNIDVTHDIFNNSSLKELYSTINKLILNKNE